MAYFDDFPDLLLPSFAQGRNSNNDVVRVKNLFKRAKIRNDVLNTPFAFDEFTIVGDARPDNIANEMYNSPFLDWVVLISNNIINVRDEWPMTQSDFQNYLIDKYGTVLLNEIHHYETLKINDPNGSLLLEEGLKVDENFTLKYSYEGEYKTLSGSNLLKSVTNYEYEVEKNDDKRNIFLLKSNYISTIISDMREIMTYTDSSQFIDKRTKKGSNLRILTPR
ncbi:MAG: hypothetical protein CBD72_05705 [Flavobacteriaceae bacterium TMED212]|nr:MAG: hypothetical protein CBC22_00100 [Alphaproteobacteria bacterium TMED62]OUW75735.1 MAG: hypothetical protein CBD72_05705 [Flavobacteriaceae bacterium TMED212]|tara:strand:+ start:23980 stop:24645 length:666 start_codon:yes stop_codon:yes gene_type:complete